MVDVSDKRPTLRTAKAFARISVGEKAFELIEKHEMKKGDVLSVAKIAGIMGAKQTSLVIPLCHPLQLTKVDLDLTLNAALKSVDISCEAKCRGETGVEMEALHGASVAALTVYDMCKAVTHDMNIERIHLMSKAGGKSDYKRQD